MPAAFVGALRQGATPTMVSHLGGDNEEDTKGEVPAAKRPRIADQLPQPAFLSGNGGSIEQAASGAILQQAAAAAPLSPVEPPAALATAAKRVRVSRWEPPLPQITPIADLQAAMGGGSFPRQPHIITSR